jgi:hypothetical protein
MAKRTRLEVEAERVVREKFGVPEAYDFEIKYVLEGMKRALELAAEMADERDREGRAYDYAHSLGHDIRALATEEQEP